MSLKKLTEALVERLVQIGSVAETEPDWPWFTLNLTGNLFARAHLQRMTGPKVDIVHCTVFPHTNDPSPVFGFDVVELNGQATAMFLDQTPTVGPEPDWPDGVTIQGHDRMLPTWATFFSKQMVSCVPTEVDMDRGVVLLGHYLDRLRPDVDGDAQAIAAAQQHYTEMQRANPKTYRMLASVIGPDRADEFIRTVMWPDVITGASHGKQRTTQ